MNRASGTADHVGASVSGGVPVVLLGSGTFAVAPFAALRTAAPELGLHVACVVSQPDRKAGRGQALAPTAVSVWALANGLPLERTDDASAGASLARIRSTGAALFVVVAFGQRLGRELLDGVAAVNLHGSLLPAWRGAEPIQRSRMAGDARVGVTVIGLADRIDAGAVFAEASTEPHDAETAGELHDRLSVLGCTPLLDTVRRWRAAFEAHSTTPLRQRATRALDSLGGVQQDERLVTRAAKLSRADAWADFTADARAVSARINGLSPWPGVDAAVGRHAVRILRARAVADGGAPSAPAGEITATGLVWCGRGAVELLDVQPPGGSVMSWDAFRRGRQIAAGAVVSCPGARAPDGDRSL
ncbi:MAG: methionyl-tRNA formyltransferase [Planctomycetota bacterium]